MESETTALDRAIDAVGTAHNLAFQVGVTPQAVSAWRRVRVPAERVLEVERVSGVSRHELRPDIYPKD